MSGILKVPARDIPIPRSISPEAQAFFEHVPLDGDFNYPALDDVAGWKRHIAEADSRIRSMLEMQAAPYPCKITERPLAKATLYELEPDSLDPLLEERAILYIHGGGFNMGGGDLAALAAVPTAGMARCRTFSIDYRMPPDHPFPHGIEDCVDAWCWLTERYDASRIGVYGASAGGNLVPALALALRDRGLPLPAVLAMHSPAADLTEGGDSFQTNRYIDVVLREPMPALMQLYAAGHDLRDPLLSPAFADYSGGFPPCILTTGTRDLLLSSTVLLHRALRRGGVEAELHVFEAMTHAPFFGAPEERELYEETYRFMLRHMAGRGR